MAIGPDGKFSPHGKLAPFDRGGITVAIKALPARRLIVMEFGTELSWLASTASEAEELSVFFRNLVKEHWGDLTYVVEELPIDVIINVDKAVIESYLPQSVSILVANPEVFLAWAQRLEEATRKFKN